MRVEEPNREQPQPAKPRWELKPRRFRIVKLDEHITPDKHPTKKCTVIPCFSAGSGAVCV